MITISRPVMVVVQFRSLPLDYFIGSDTATYIVLGGSSGMHGLLHAESIAVQVFLLEQCCLLIFRLLYLMRTAEC